VQCVVDLNGTEQLGAVEGGHGSGGQGAERHTQPGQHPRGPQQGEGQRVGPIVAGGRVTRLAGIADVDQLVLEESLVDHGEAPGRHEPTGREGGQAELVDPAFCRQPAVHHIEGALGLGSGGRFGQG
jgi:hypothetical protein